MLGILIGVVVTLLLVAFVIMLILRIKYKTSKRNNHENRNAAAGNNPQTDLEDDEEYFCLKPSERPMATLQRSQLRNVNGSGDSRHLMGNPVDHGDSEHNPDIIPGMTHHHHLNIQCAGKNSTIPKCPYWQYFRKLSVADMLSKSEVRLLFTLKV